MTSNVKDSGEKTSMGLDDSVDNLTLPTVGELKELYQAARKGGMKMEKAESMIKTLMREAAHGVVFEAFK